MHFRINVQIHWDTDREDRNVVFARLRRMFTQFRAAFPESRVPKDGIGWADFETRDESIIPRIAAWLDKEKEKYELVVIDCWTIEEMVRARWLELLYHADYVDVNDRLERFNRYPVVLCQACGRLDHTIVPVPYKVRDLVLRKNADIFPAFNGLLIVKEQVRDLLVNAAQDEIEWGETSFVNALGKAVRSAAKDSKFFWVRPKHVIGKDLRGKPESPCVECGSFTRCPPVRDSDAKVVNGRFMVEHFGNKQFNIATVGNWQVTDLQTIVVSGGLWAHLYNCGVKGLVLPEGPLYSAKGEPPIEGDRRFANLKSGKDDKVLRLKMWWQKKKPF